MGKNVKIHRLNTIQYETLPRNRDSLFYDVPNQSRDIRLKMATLEDKAIWEDGEVNLNKIRYCLTIY
jgi:hypothetical protein